MSRVLIATGSAQAAEAIPKALPADSGIVCAGTLDACLEAFQRDRFDYTFVDVTMLLGDDEVAGSGARLHDALTPFWAVLPDAEIVVLCSRDHIRLAVAAVRAGASDYLTMPVRPEELKLVLNALAETARLQSEIDYLRDESWRTEEVGEVRTRSARMQELFRKARLVAPTRSNVLITGETGTGKGLLAELIHRYSVRRDAQFVSIHCGAFPETLIESELFGHEKGAFTGAQQRRLGRFEIADGGTIFLDEVGTLSVAMQTKLLEVLQKRSFFRIGGEMEVAVDVRIIAATNADLKSMVDAGDFRRDLFYRLNVFPIELPPLRRRPEDIPLLAECFIRRLNRLNTKTVRSISPAALQALCAYPWPGNVRELENVVERAFILEQSAVLTPQSLPAELVDETRSGSTPWSPDISMSLAAARRTALACFERDYLEAQLTAARGRIGKAAEAAGIGPRQLHKLMKRYGLRKEDFRERS